MRVVILGLSISSSWGNGHATNYRALARALVDRGDDLVFLERDMPWYAAHRDLPEPPWGETILYGAVSDLEEIDAVADADLVIVGSFVPDGVAVSELVLERANGVAAFYDIDTPVTIGKLRDGDAEYLTPELAARFGLYLSFTGGPALEVLRAEFGVARPHAFLCFVDAAAYVPLPGIEPRWALSYLGTYSEGRQATVEALLCEPARTLGAERFAVAGPMYPSELTWPPNVERIEHLPPGEHPGFYCASRFTLNVTRPEMRALGHSPSVRLFEAAACAAPVISDRWPGLEELFEPGREILLADTAPDVVAILRDVGEEERRAIGAAARKRVLAEHTAAHRVEQLHAMVAELRPASPHPGTTAPARVRPQGELAMEPKAAR